jgi:tight adherence protein C
MPASWAPTLLAAWSAGLAAASWTTREDEKVRARVACLSSVARRGAFGRTLILMLGRTPLGARLRSSPDLENRLVQVGARWSAEQVAGLKLLALAVSGGLILTSMVLWPPGMWAGLVAIPVIVRAPDVLIARQASSRRAAVDHYVLEFVELLVAATEAGLPPAAAVQRSAGLVRGPLGTELERAGREIALGLDWRAALEHVSSRTSADALRRLVLALGRAHRLGTSARASLRAIADELRAERRARAEELARRAPVKMLFPLVFLILPAFLLLTVGPVLLATIRTLH